MLKMRWFFTARGNGSMKYTFIGLAIWGFVGFVLWHIRPASRMHRVVLTQDALISKIICIISCAATILFCIIPMNLVPLWNGEIPDHRNQYELMADSILEGHIYFDYDVDQKLLEMENPYDTDARKELGVDYHWDHAFYNGKYYMYFGIVPTLLVFVPYKVLTGTSLTTYHATQLFVALFIVGLFKLFRIISSRFFKNITNAVFIFGCVSFSLFSVWYFVDVPALYCTAISSAVCFEVWSFFFFFKAIYDSETEKQTVIAAILGSLLGALAFGCRPPAALANFIIIPVIVMLARDKHVRISKLFLIIIPYIVVGALLMWYNYVRFDNPFEFGQSYQLTVTDQSMYGDLLSRLDINRIASWLRKYSVNFPRNRELVHYGILLMYPIVTISCVAVLKKKNLSMIRNSHLQFPIIVMICTVGIIIAFSSACAPNPSPRYTMDFCWLIAIISFVFIGFELENANNREIISSCLTLLMCVSIGASILRFLTPNDANYTYYYPDSVRVLKEIATLGLLK